MSDIEYWASKPSEEVGQEIFKRVEEFYDNLKKDGFYYLLRKSYNAYYGIQGGPSGQMFMSSDILRGGKQGENYNFKANIYRNVLQHMLVLVTSERPAYETMAVNTDFKSQSQAELGDGLLEYYTTEKRSDRSMVRACEYSLFLGSGHVSVTWNPSAGRQYSVNPETGMPVHEGDLQYEAHTPIDVGVDPTCADHRRARWKWVRRWVNRYDLIAEYPDLAEDIARIESRDEEIESWNFTTRFRGESSDEIPVFDWYHDKSPAMPDGRMVSILPGGIVLFDGPLPYQAIPIYTIMPATYLDTPYGYSPGFDMLAVQVGIDEIYSCIITNLIAFGKNNIGVPQGHNFRHQSLEGGLNIIEFDPALGPPVPINLAQTPPQLLEFAMHLEKTMEKLGGINSVVRGDPEGALKGSSGAALALLASQAIQFSYGLQREYEYLHEDVGTATLKTLQMYANTARVALIAGKSKRPYLQEFTGDDLANVDRVVFKRASAISKTTAGKTKIAEDLLANQLIKDAEQYIAVIKTGNLEPMTERPRTKQLNIRRENELLKEGQMVQALISDNHVQHIDEHLAILDDPSARMSPQVVQNVLAHVTEHQSLWASMTPDLLAATGQNPSPMAQMMAAPPQMGSAPPSGGDPNASSVQEPMSGPEQFADQMPSQPGMPGLPQGAPPEAQQAYEQMNAMTGGQV